VANYSKHSIFYLREAWGIGVVRVLHGSQDTPALFTRDESS
jgi:plasmid stabilization system protein ParE